MRMARMPQAHPSPPATISADSARLEFKQNQINLLDTPDRMFIVRSTSYPTERRWAPRMTTNRPFLGETTDREKAFPNIEILEIMIVQDPSEQYDSYAWQRESRYTKVDIQRRLACLNPRCPQDGPTQIGKAQS